MQKSLYMFQVFNYLRQVAKTSAELLCLVAHCSAVIKQYCIKVSTFSKGKLAAAFLLLAYLTAWLS